MRRLTICLILAYRWLLSPMLGRHCRFHPTCSSYALAAFRTFPFWRALRLALARIGRCHPWHPGGYDPLPENDGPCAEAGVAAAPLTPTHGRSR